MRLSWLVLFVLLLGCSAPLENSNQACNSPSEYDALDIQRDHVMSEALADLVADCWGTLEDDRDYNIFYAAVEEYGVSHANGAFTKWRNISGKQFSVVCSSKEQEQYVYDVNEHFRKPWHQQIADESYRLLNTPRLGCRMYKTKNEDRGCFVCQEF